MSEFFKGLDQVLAKLTMRDFQIIDHLLTETELRTPTCDLYLRQTFQTGDQVNYPTGSLVLFARRGSKGPLSCCLEVHSLCKLVTFGHFSTLFISRFHA